MARAPQRRSHCYNGPVLPSIVRGLLDRLLLVGAVVAAGLVPGFISQYRQRLGGRLDQAQADLSAWQRIADQFFHGNLQQLITHHLQSSDATFRSEAAVVRTLIATVQSLQQAANALHADLWHQLVYLAGHLDRDLARATLTDWIPTFALTLPALTFAIALALLLWLTFHALWWLTSRLLAARR